MGDTIGSMSERLVIQRSDPETFDLSSLTRSGTTATAITTKAHGYETGDYVRIAGASPDGYNGKVKITVTTTTAFTYTVSGALASPATHAVTVTYVSDAQGGRRTTWRDLVTVWAEMIPLRASERLQIQAVQSDVAYRFRVRTRNDLAPTMRALWTPRWPARAATHTLEINGVLPVEDGRTFVYLECAESPRVAA